MKIRTRRLLAIVVLVPLWTSAVSGGMAEYEGDWRIPVPITLLVRNFAAVPAAVLDSAARQVIQIFEEVGVEVVWLNCGRTNTAAEACKKGPADPSHYVLSLLPYAPSEMGIRPSALGISFGRSAIVFIDRIRHESGTFRVPEHLVLACVAAHEVGHLLLPRRYHSINGLMAARLVCKEWAAEVGGRPHFAPEEGRRMRAILRSRRGSADGISLGRSV